MSGPRRAVLVLAVLGLALGALPVYYRATASVKYRNFRAVVPGELYRSGQLTTEGLAAVTTQYGIRTVISLREETKPGADGKATPDNSEAEYCRLNKIRHEVLLPEHWYAPPGQAVPVEGNLRKYLSIVRDPSQRPVLVHCFAGIHRTGGYVALYRVECEGWTADEAIREMQSMGTVRTTFDDEIPNYLRQYRRGQLDLKPR